MTEPVFSPHEIATFLLDSGFIDKGTAHRLEKRIAAYGESCAHQQRRQGIEAAVRKAASIAASMKSDSQRLAAQKVWRGIQSLLPERSREAEREAYARGFKDGAEHRSRQQQTPARPSLKS
jgi:hypothetical protein